jgi:hypothetical protein
MAVYKVIQDIEAEDKLLGPLTLKGFIYAMIAGTCAYINFRLLMVGTPLKWVFILMFAMPMILFGVLASPLGREQPTEVWLLSRIRFFLKPRSRVWGQSGIQELVKITAPKKQEAVLTKDLSQHEVHSRLKTLALTLDTRGWAIKNVDVNLSVPEATTQTITPESDRLVGAAGVPKQMPVVDVRAEDDILDEKNNPVAKKFDAMMQHAEAERKRGILAALMGLVDKDEDKYRASSSKDSPATKAALAKMQRERTAQEAKRKAKQEAELEEKLAKARANFSAEFAGGQKKPNPSHKLFNSASGSPTSQPAKTDVGTAAKQVTANRQTDNMELAQSGSAFSVATLSQLANRPSRVEQTGPDEITISLH